MVADLQAKLAQVAARLAATQERLRGLERSAASVRHDLERLRTEVERAAEPGAVPVSDEWGGRVPTRPLQPPAAAPGEAAGEGAPRPGSASTGKRPRDR